MLSWILALCSQNSHIMLCHVGIHTGIHFVVHVLVEPQSSGTCAFFVLASGHKYNKIHEYPHTKVSIHARDQMIEKRKHHFFHSLVDFFLQKDFFITKFV